MAPTVAETDAAALAGHAPITPASIKPSFALMIRRTRSTTTQPKPSLESAPALRTILVCEGQPVIAPQPASFTELLNLVRTVYDVRSRTPGLVAKVLSTRSAQTRVCSDELTFLRKVRGPRLLAPRHPSRRSKA